ncbi:MAG: radical SAM protein [Candidatus Schekmanbacteria bacterium]|nr:radical SAM protein [Candidatus Schekmanbacteria bacterium]
MAWPLVQLVNGLVPRTPLAAAWAPAVKPRKGELSGPPLGWPRETDSLCPECVREARAKVLSGEKDWRFLIEESPGHIPALISEKDGKIVIEKTCPAHGAFSDVLSVDPAFTAHIESMFRGRDFKAVSNGLRDYGISTIKYGRGAVLTIDLTNRCNMMCEPCFMDANQVGYVHELTLADIKQILDRSLTTKPRRQMSVNFSGGEPTLSPFFLDAVRYADEIGYFCIQASTNGIRFAQDRDLAKRAKEAGLRIAYLQFDGIGNEIHNHRKVANLYDVKMRAIDNLAAAGVDVVLVVTVVNGINDHHVGKIVQFAVENAEKVTVVSFQPVSFTGRDEGITDERRKAQRYTLSHLANDVCRQSGYTNPVRDWFPLAALTPFSDFVDVLLGANASVGSMNCGCHPNCGAGMILFVNKKTKQCVPLGDFINIKQLLDDMQVIADANRSKPLTLAQATMALMRNFDPQRAPISITTLVRQFLSQTGALDFAGQADAHQYDWRLLFVAGMWFQDLWTYDFRRTEMCTVPYGTQMGEISFCAYNTGVGWRQIVEHTHQTASAKDWFKTAGRHAIYAGGKEVPLDGEASADAARATSGPAAEGAVLPRPGGSNGHGNGNGNGNGRNGAHPAGVNGRQSREVPAAEPVRTADHQ